MARYTPISKQAPIDDAEQPEHNKKLHIIDLNWLLRLGDKKMLIKVYTHQNSENCQKNWIDRYF